MSVVLCVFSCVNCVREKLVRVCRTFWNSGWISYLLGRVFIGCVAWSVSVSCQWRRLSDCASDFHLRHDRDFSWRACGSELGLFARVDGVLFISLSSFNRLDVSSARGGVLYNVFRVFVVYSFWRMCFFVIWGWSWSIRFGSIWLYLLSRSIFPCHLVVRFT